MAAVSSQSPSNAAGPSTASSSKIEDPIVAAEAHKRLYPRRYLEAFLEEGYRPDGRKIGDWRKCQINTGSISTANGSALVRLGDTTIVCGVKAEVAEPDWNRPEEGWIVPNVDFPAVSSSQFKPGPPVDEAQVYSQQLYDFLLSTDIVPLRSLCIEPRRSCWVIYIDLVCINYDGNAFDASVLAIMAALKDATLPLAVYDDETTQTWCSPEDVRPLLPRDADNLPLSCTFAVFDGRYLLPDPTAFELPLCSTLYTIALDPSKQAQRVPGSKQKTKSQAKRTEEEEMPQRIRFLRQSGIGGLRASPTDDDSASTSGTRNGSSRGEGPMDGLTLMSGVVTEATERVNEMSKILEGTEK